MAQRKTVCIITGLQYPTALQHYVNRPRSAASECKRQMVNWCDIFRECDIFYVKEGEEQNTFLAALNWLACCAYAR